MNCRRTNLDRQEVMEKLSYDLITGVFRWRQTGKFAGCVNGTGYRLIGFNGQLYLAHRLAWFYVYVYGAWPAKGLDHIDGDKLNNSIRNLREASHLENSNNTGPRKNNISGVKGVSWDAFNCKWRATINVNGKQKSLGRYVRIEDAAKAYKNASRRIHGYFVHASTEAIDKQTGKGLEA